MSPPVGPRDGRVSEQILGRGGRAAQDLPVRVRVSRQTGSGRGGPDPPVVTLRVTTYRAGQHEARRLGASSLMTHPWGNPRVHIEGCGGGQLITEADEVDRFRSAFEHAGRIALSPRESTAFVQRLADMWRSNA